MTEEIDTQSGADPSPDQASLQAIADASQAEVITGASRYFIDMAAADSDQSRRFGTAALVTPEAYRRG
jgi:hypothetical protein